MLKSAHIASLRTKTLLESVFSISKKIGVLAFPAVLVTSDAVAICRAARFF